jgi:hypothetical protein
MTNPEYVAYVGQAVGVFGMLVAFAIMLWLRAKERREKAKRQVERSLTPPAEPAPDRPDWRGAPAGKPR